MATQKTTKVFTIDAAGRTLGRVASDAAQTLQGKRSADFVRNMVPDIEVVVTNASKMSITAKRAAGKVYTRYTGFPGGLREMTMKEMMQKKGIGEVLRKTIDGMIPRNKLRKERMKRLKIED